METSTAAGADFIAGSPATFTGEVWLRPTLRGEDGTNIGIVHFSPGARTHWHRHPGGQFLVALSGRGRVRTKGGRGHELLAGDVVRVGPAEWHFHGGAPGSPLVHVAVNQGGDAEWGDPVTDEEYDESF